MSLRTEGAEQEVWKARPGTWHLHSPAVSSKRKLRSSGLAFLPSFSHLTFSSLVHLLIILVS